MASYLPDTDNALRNWAQNFSTLITATPSTYGVVAADATAISAVVNAFNSALTLVVDPSTKTKSTVADKNAKKAAMCTVLRHYAQQIKNTTAVTNAERAALGLTIADTTRTPIPAPSTQPVCSVTNAMALQHTLRFADATTPTKRAKPAGVTGLEIYCFVGATPPVLPDVNGTAIRFCGIASRQSFVVTHNAADVGKTATYYVRWITRTGLTGPWSVPVSVTIAA